MLAADLRSALAPSHPVVSLTIDGFHQPREVRTRRGDLDPEGYYRDAFDLAAVVDDVLRPPRSRRGSSIPPSDLRSTCRSATPCRLEHSSSRCDPPVRRRLLAASRTAASLGLPGVPTRAAVSDAAARPSTRPRSVRVGEAGHRAVSESLPSRPGSLPPVGANQRKPCDVVIDMTDPAQPHLRSQLK